MTYADVLEELRGAQEAATHLAGRVLKLREACDRRRRALERIRAVVAGLDERCVHPQYGTLTTEAEREIVRLVDLALKDGAG